MTSQRVRLIKKAASLSPVSTVLAEKSARNIVSAIYSGDENLFCYEIEQANKTFGKHLRGYIAGVVAQSLRQGGNE